MEFTAKAKEKLSFFMSDKNPEEWALRIHAQGGDRFHFALDRTDSLAATDQLQRIDDVQIIFEKELEPRFKTARIDFLDTAWSSGFKIDFKETENTPTELPSADLENPVVQKIQHLLTDEINPALAGHGGQVTLLGYKEGIVYVRMEGGCQGCSMSSATLRNGIELRLKEEIPEILGLIDQTDHSLGASPYFS